MKVLCLKIPVGQMTAVVLCAALVGCGGGGEEQAPAQEQPEAAAQPAETPAQQPASSEAEQVPAQATPEEPQPTVVRESESSEYGFYTIQLSAWRTEAKARSQARHYQDLGLEAYVQRAEMPGMGTWYRVRVGKYPRLSEARRAAQALVNIPFDRVWLDNFMSEEVPPGTR